MWPASSTDGPLEIGYAALASRTVVRTVSAGPADGPPVLFLHGWGCSVFLWRHNLPALAAAGFRAIAVDLKGHGLSDKPERDGEYTLDALARHVIEILDALALRAATLIGQSMGARIAMEVARRAPARVERLVLVAPVGLGDVALLPLVRVAALRWLEPFGTRVVTRPLMRLLLTFVYGRRAAVTAATVDGYFAPMQYAEFPRVMQRILREFAWEPVSGAVLASIRAPVLIVLGTRDGILRLRRDASALPPADGVRTIWIEDAGHTPNEECPDDVNDAVLRFLGAPGTALPSA